MKKLIYLLLSLLFIFSITGCFSLKESPFYDSEWIMQNYDSEGRLYYHHLILRSDHTVMLRSSYADSTNIIVWRGTFKIDSKKITFNFEDCSRFENGENVGQYSDKRLVKFYSGEYFYSVGLIGSNPGETVLQSAEEAENRQYHLQLIRPKNQIYGDTTDIYGNHFEEFVKVPKLN